MMSPQDPDRKEVPTPPEGFPRRTDYIDERLKKNLDEAHRFRWALVAVAFVTLVAATIFLGYTSFSQQQELVASCEVWRILSPQPVTINPATHAPTRLSVSIIAGARRAYLGQKCGAVLPADPSVTHWAHVYHITLP